MMRKANNGWLKTAALIIGIIGGAVGIMTALGWAPWHMVARAEAEKAHDKIVAESKERLAKRAHAANQVHEAMLQRIQRTETDDSDLREELKTQRKEQLWLLKEILKQSKQTR
jgi:hypothetical protein